MGRIISMGWRKDLCSHYLPINYSAMACKNLRRKKGKQFVLESGRKVFSDEFFYNFKCFLPKTLLIFKGYLKLETTVHQSFHQRRRIKFELVLSGWWAASQLK